MIELLTVENAIALVTLTSLEIVLGIDNVVFIAILTSPLPDAARRRARSVGLTLAMGTRVALLLAISWVMGLTRPLFALMRYEFSGRDLILLAGGLFLIGKSTFEIHARIEGGESHRREASTRSSFAGVIVQILLLDLIFSLDSVITAVGMAREIAVMVIAVIVAVGIMLVFAGQVSALIERHPTLKMLALAFLLLIGVMLMAEGLDRHVEKGYIYFAMGFSLGVELLNIRAGRARAAHADAA